MLAAAMVLAVACGTAAYQIGRDTFRQSPVAGRLLCGEGLMVDDVPAPRRGRMFVCRDSAGTIVSATNNGVGFRLALPFFAVFAIPALIVPWVIRKRPATARWWR